MKNIENYYQDIVVESCPNKRIQLTNTQTGESFMMPCKSYQCPHCGKIKKWKLQNAIRSELKHWKRVRFWTFTLSNRIGTPIEHLYVLREAWRRLISDLKKEFFSFRYIKIFEPHKSGFTHIHVCINIYLPFYTMLNRWRKHVRNVMRTKNENYYLPDYFASCYVKGDFSYKVATFYLTKYIIKSVLEKKRIYIQVYSKSRAIVFFGSRKKTGIKWEVCLYFPDGRYIIIHKQKDNLLDIALNLESITQSVEQPAELFLNYPKSEHNEYWKFFQD